MGSLNKKANSLLRDARGLIPLALVGGLGYGGYKLGQNALEDYDLQSPFRSPLKTKPLSVTKLKEVAKDPATYLTLLALLGGGYGAYQLGKNREKKDLLPSPELTELMNSPYLY